MRLKSRIFKAVYILLVFISVLAINTNPAYAIRIGLLTNTDFANVAASKTGMFINGHTGQKIMDLTPMQVCIIRPAGSNLAATLGNSSYNLGTNYVVLKTQDSGFVFAKRKWYRGNLIIFNSGNAVTVINDIDLESYLMGVVPAEMPSKWNIEAHKAQAIAARSYAMANLGKRAKYGYDLKDTPEDQAYGGASAETARTNAAVTQTKGQVLVYGNKIIPAYYHSSSGGYTINSGAVWYRDLPFIREVPSFDGNLPKRGHGVGMSQHGANILANYGYNAYQILGYFYQNVRLYVLNKAF